MDCDLQLAATLGLLLIEEAGIPGGARIRSGCLYYDPTLTKSKRFRAVVGEVTRAVQKKVIVTHIL